MAASSLGEKQVDLLVLGKTGHGKSSSANAILGRQAFCVSDHGESETFVPQTGWARRLGRVIKVIDSPGLCETRLKKGQATSKAIKDMEQCILQCPEGFHALILVLKYGNRFTKEEMKTIEMLKSMFGDTFVRDYCILIFTHGEVFDMNNKDTPQRTFSNWCQDQKGALKDVLEECNYKAVLFRNKTSEMEEEQLQELLLIVDDISNDGVRYSNEIFKRAAEEREKLIVRKNAPELREAVQAKINLLVDGLEKLKEMKSLDEQAQLMVDTMRKDCKELQAHIAEKDRGTGILDSLRLEVDKLLLSLSSQEEVLKLKDDAAKAQEMSLATQLEMCKLRDEAAKAQAMSRANQAEVEKLQELKKEDERLLQKSLQMQEELKKKSLKMEAELQERIDDMSKHMELQLQNEAAARKDEAALQFWYKAGEILTSVAPLLLQAFERMSAQNKNESDDSDSDSSVD